MSWVNSVTYVRPQIKVLNLFLIYKSKMIISASEMIGIVLFAAD